MVNKIEIHPDIQSGSRIIGVPDATDAPMMAKDAAPDFSLFRTSSNLEDTALDAIKPIILGENAIIITGCENLMSVLAMAMTLRPGLRFADRSALRVILTSPPRPNGRVAHTAGLTAQRLLAHFLRPNGVYISDPRDFRAIAAAEAIASGAIRVRVLSPEKLERKGAYPARGIQANMAVGDDFAALSTGGFSRQDLMDRIVVLDRVGADREAFVARHSIATQFWAAGHPCNREISEILDHMLTPVNVEQAVCVGLKALLSYAPFSSLDDDTQVHRDLVGQALGRVYENGFAFVSVPAGGGQADVDAEVERRLDLNAARMIGGDATVNNTWAAHVETSTGGSWSDERILWALGESAPLSLDGSISQKPGETIAGAVLRRMRCRASAYRGVPGESGFEGFPTISPVREEIALTKGQLTGFEVVRDEVQKGIDGALDAASQAGLTYLAEVAQQSVEAAHFIWKQGMSGWVRTTAKGAPEAKEVDQNILPIFAQDDADDGAGVDVIGQALASRAFRAIDRSYLERIAELAAARGQVICLVEDDLARHALAKKAAELMDGPILAVVSEAGLRRNGVPGRSASYQRAESSEIGMSMLGVKDAEPLVVFLSAADAAEMTFPLSKTVIVISAPEDVESIAAGLSCVDGLGKAAETISCLTFDDGIERISNADNDLALFPADLVEAATKQMRTAITEAPDGIIDIMSAVEARLPDDIEVPELGYLCIATLDSVEEFSVFVVSGTSEEADQAMMPPRLLVVRRDSESAEEVILRNQVGCADFLSSIEWPERSADPRVHSVLPEMEVLGTIGRHMSHLTHWDARPERLVRLLQKLAGFVSFDKSTDEDLFSDLCLVSLEVIARRWVHHLLESRELGQVVDPGLNEAFDALLDRPVWEIDAVRGEMINLIDRRIVEDAARPKTLHERVVAVIHGTGGAGLEV